MADDFSLAQGLLDDTPRAQRRFARRYRDRLSAVLEYCREARSFGLGLDDWGKGVAWRAAASFLASSPMGGEGRQSLDLFVERVLKHRDVAMTIVLGQGGEDVWDRFRGLYEDYINSLFLRRGETAQQAREGTNQLFAWFRSVDPSTNRMRIEAYAGRCELVVWLVASVRLFRDAEVDPPMAAAAGPAVLLVSDAEDAALLECWLSLDEKARTLLSRVASGELFADGGETTRKDTWREVSRRLSGVMETLLSLDREDPNRGLLDRLSVQLDSLVEPSLGDREDLHE